VTSQQLVKSARQLSVGVGKLRFAPPVAYVYNPLDYAWLAHKAYLKKFGNSHCPLAFLESSGRNLTPDKLPAAEKTTLFAACDGHLRQVVRVLEPQWLVGIGDFALKRAEQVFQRGEVKIGRILHPSPASPAANRDWAGLAVLQLRALGIWE
jgi:single-strand selective monofunctional uracil DNA glycosylase